jgi:hypothetical protein
MMIAYLLRIDADQNDNNMLQLETTTDVSLVRDMMFREAFKVYILFYVSTPKRNVIMYPSSSDIKYNFEKSDLFVSIASILVRVIETVTQTSAYDNETTIFLFYKE